MSLKLSVLEFFCGIGGFAASVGSRAKVVAAVDISQAALNVYALNFPRHPIVNREIETLKPAWYEQFSADLWWLSPPCQPYTVKGRQRDLDDPRARSLLTLIQRIRAARPRYVALENVPPFQQSRAHSRLVRMLRESGYEIAEHLLCPTQLGWPMRRNRYYLVASLVSNLLPLNVSLSVQTPLRRLLDNVPPAELELPTSVWQRWAPIMHVVEAQEARAQVACFASSYGRSWKGSGSYLQTSTGVRFFSPQEILRLMGFPTNFRLPEDLPRRTAWAMLGNSLSVTSMQRVLATIPELAELAGATMTESTRVAK